MEDLPAVRGPFITPPRRRNEQGVGPTCSVLPLGAFPPPRLLPIEFVVEAVAATATSSHASETGGPACPSCVALHVELQLCLLNPYEGLSRSRRWAR